MADHIHIRPALGTWVVRAGDAVIAETHRALELAEDDCPPVIYFPREDVAMAFLESSATVTRCPWKGEARHFAIAVPAGVIADAAWSYEEPKEGMEAIAGHLAFSSDKTAVEKI